MSKPVVTIDGGESVVDLYRQMSEPGHDYSKRTRLVVVEKGKVIGVINRSQVFESSITRRPRSHSEHGLLEELPLNQSQRVRLTRPSDRHHSTTVCT